MITIPSKQLHQTRKNEATSTKRESATDNLGLNRSPRSASCDDRSAVPFSVNESDLLGANCNGDYDSAHASIADWIDIFDSSKIAVRPDIGIEFEPSEV